MKKIYPATESDFKRLRDAFIDWQPQMLPADANFRGQPFPAIRAQVNWSVTEIQRSFGYRTWLYTFYHLEWEQ